jgi:hypothetical protein
MPSGVSPVAQAPANSHGGSQEPGALEIGVKNGSHGMHASLLTQYWITTRVLVAMIDRVSVN